MFLFIAAKMLVSESEQEEEKDYLEQLEVHCRRYDE